MCRFQNLFYWTLVQLDSFHFFFLLFLNTKIVSHDQSCEKLGNQLDIKLPDDYSWLFNECDYKM